MTVYDLIEKNFYVDSTTMQLFGDKEDAIAEMLNRESKYMKDCDLDMLLEENSDTKITLVTKEGKVYTVMKIIERELL